MQELKKPIGDFIINNSKGTQTENGVYYHYTEVCRLLKLYEKQLLIQRVVVNEADIAIDKTLLDEPLKLSEEQSLELESSEVELCECNCPLIRTGTKERPEYCGNCEKDI